MVRYKLLVISLLVGLTSFGQSNFVEESCNPPDKNGYFVICGYQKPEKGYCDTCIIEEGNYLNDRKEGEWIKYHKNYENTVRLIGTYKRNRPNGDYKKFYENGQLMEVGTYRRGKQKQVHLRYHESGCLAAEKFFNQEGSEDGCVTFLFDDCDTSVTHRGTIEYEFEKEDGITTWPINRISGPCKWPVEKGPYYIGHDPKVLLKGNRGDFRNDGTIVFHKSTNSIPAPTSVLGNPKNKSTIDPNGYNKLYNKNDEIVLDGNFRDDSLYDGKFYKYDADGILVKIEVWKKGKFVKNGALE